MPDDSSFDPRSALTGGVGRTDAGEAVFCNGVPGEAMLSICVPSFHDDATPLIATLSRMPEASRTTLIIFDDGSGDEELTRKLARQVMSYPGPARLVTAPANNGRAHARNRLLALAETDWILFIDADMRPDSDVFLNRYMAAIRRQEGPALIAGGFTLWQVMATRKTALHAAQSSRSECLPALKRQEAPGRYVFTSNIVVHRDILATVDFDDSFTGWGWEDVDWGLRVAESFPVDHIDNTATHLGLDDTETLLNKFGGSGANFARLAERHPDAARQMTLWKMARRLRRLPGRTFWTPLSRLVAQTSWMPIGLRLTALKTYRALRYGEHLA